MMFRRSRLFFGLVVLVTMAATVALSRSTYRSLVEYQNRKQLVGLNELIIRRTEMAVDYAFISLSDLVENGITYCDQSFRGRLRNTIYRRGSLKDIRLLDALGNPICSAYSDATEYDNQRVTATDRIPALNARIELFSLGRGSSAALGVFWRVEDEFSLVAVVNTDSLLFDVVPEGLRHNSKVTIELSSGVDVATYAGENFVETAKGRGVEIVSSSARYPLRASMSLEVAALAAWNNELEPYVLAGNALVGLLLGLLLVKLVGRGPDAVAELDLALARNEFRPFMQPIFSLDDGKIVGCEVLARWVKADGSIVSPLRFIPLAEDSGRIKQLTAKIVGQALHDLQPWLEKHRKFKVGFNVSPSLLLSPGFADEFRLCVARSHVSFRQVVIEVTERQEIHDTERAGAVIAHLRDLGFHIALDDVGTGHSGLSHIQKLGVNILKIDKLFVDAIESNHAARVLIEMIVSIAHKLKMGTVAEGIETEEQIAALRALGVEAGQGYIRAAPAPFAQFSVMLEVTRALELSGEGRTTHAGETTERPMAGAAA